jgi:hypothetical protein
MVASCGTGKQKLNMLQKIDDEITNEKKILRFFFKDKKPFIVADILMFGFENLNNQAKFFVNSYSR